jgi:hypothetical protein
MALPAAAAAAVVPRRCRPLQQQQPPLVEEPELLEEDGANGRWWWRQQAPRLGPLLRGGTAWRAASKFFVCSQIIGCSAQLVFILIVFYITFIQ